MPSLRDLQARFADALLAPPGSVPDFAPGAPAQAAARMDVYRNAMAANYRRALHASYPVVARLVGPAFFDAAVDAYVRARPSKSGDLNVYGDDFGDFLATYPHAADLPYLTDVARLEWAIDESQRAADEDEASATAITLSAASAAVAAPTNAAAAPAIATAKPAIATAKPAIATAKPAIAATTLETLAALPPERLPEARLQLAPSVRLVASAHPILRIWQVNQAGHDGDAAVSLDEGADWLLVQRDETTVTIARITAAEHAFLAALGRNATLGEAIDAALAVDAAFDLAAAMRAHALAAVISARSPVSP